MTHAPTSPVTRAEAFARARTALDAARARRDAMPIRDAARAAAAHGTRTAEQIEADLYRLRELTARVTAHAA